LRGLKIILFLNIFLITLQCAAAEDPAVRYIGIEQGLSNNAVTSIFQDHYGFMWFGTYDGLNRYDGYGFKIFRSFINDSTSINDNHISVITEDANHRLWIGSEKGLNIYNPVKSNFYSTTYKSWSGASPQPLLEVVRAIQKINANDMLVGTLQKG